MRKIYLIPNFVTTANMFCGFYSVVESMNGNYLSASWLIIAASVFDALDGRIARLARATSVFGVQYDSLSDLISFGMAPSFLMYLWALQDFDRLGWLAAFLFLACGALRLARFNVLSGRLPAAFFQGLPIPGGAGVVATFVIFQNETQFPSVELTPVVGLGLTLFLASLMISTIPFPSFKELNWRSRATFGYLMVGVMAMILVAVKPEITVFVLLMSYLVLSLLWAFVAWTKGTLPNIKSSAVLRGITEQNTHHSS